MVLRVVVRFSGLVRPLCNPKAQIISAIQLLTDLTEELLRQPNGAEPVVISEIIRLRERRNYPWRRQALRSQTDLLGEHDERLGNPKDLRPFLRGPNLSPWIVLVGHEETRVLTCGDAPELGNQPSPEFCIFER